MVSENDTDNGGGALRSGGREYCGGKVKRRVPQSQGAPPPRGSHPIISFGFGRRILLACQMRTYVVCMSSSDDVD